MADVIDLSERRRERETGLRLVISFEDRPGGCSCADFVLGVEIGQLAVRLEARPESWNGTYHTKNLVMVQRVAEARGYEALVTPSGDETWIFVEFIPRPRK